MLGDCGRVYWRDYDLEPDGNTTNIVAVSGGGGYGDLTDGKVRFVANALSRIVFNASENGGSDHLYLNHGK